MIVLLSIWIVIGSIMFVCTKKALDGDAANIAYNIKAVWITCTIVGLLWPLIIVLSIIIWITKMIKIKKISMEIRNKIESAFNS